MVWDEVDELAPLCPTGSVIRVLGRYTVDERYGATLTVGACAPPSRASTTWPT